jgi:hypothetical protein
MEMFLERFRLIERSVDRPHVVPVRGRMGTTPFPLPMHMRRLQSQSRRDAGEIELLPENPQRGRVAEVDRSLTSVDLLLVRAMHKGKVSRRLVRDERGFEINDALMGITLPHRFKGSDPIA